MSSTGPFQTNNYVLLQLPNFFCIFLGLLQACRFLSWLPLSTKVPALLNAVGWVSPEPPLGKPDTLLNSAVRVHKGSLLSYHLLCYCVVCLIAAIFLLGKAFVGIKTCFGKPIFMINKLVSSKTVTRTVSNIPTKEIAAQWYWQMSAQLVMDMWLVSVSFHQCDLVRMKVMSVHCSLWGTVAPVYGCLWYLFNKCRKHNRKFLVLCHPIIRSLWLSSFFSPSKYSCLSLWRAPLDPPFLLNHFSKSFWVTAFSFLPPFGFG